jgi:translation initiation factor 1
MGKKLSGGKRWEIIRPGEKAPEPEISLPPSEQRVKLALEKRKGNRVVTVVSGLKLTTGDRKALLRELKDALSTGGTAGEDSILLQGDHRDGVRRLLTENGYRV